jgi:hypothetical protein
MGWDQVRVSSGLPPVLESEHVTDNPNPKSQTHHPSPYTKLIPDPAFSAPCHASASAITVSSCWPAGAA